TQSKPWAATAAPISGASVAHTTRSKHAAPKALSKVWTMSGLPKSGVSSFPKKRVEPRRAGTTHVTPERMRLAPDDFGDGEVFEIDFGCVGQGLLLGEHFGLDLGAQRARGVVDGGHGFDVVELEFLEGVDVADEVAERALELFDLLGGDFEAGQFGEFFDFLFFNAHAGSSSRR